MTCKRLKILLIGAFPPPLGGGTISFEYLYNGLKNRDDVEVYFIRTSGIRGQKLIGLGRFIRLLYQMFSRVPFVDVVSLHVITTGIPIIGPFVIVISRIFRKPVIVRKFATSDYKDYDLLRRILSRWVLKKADLYLAETKHLVKRAKEDNIEHVAWYPTNRPLASGILEKPTKQHCRRFVYIGHVMPMKGIKYMINAAERFDEDVTVDVYGPFMEGLSEKTFNGCNRIHYKGIVLEEKKMEILCSYDAMLMPTCFDTEGYPGSVIEAYIAGLPVICSRIGALPEIVDETCGILVEPANADSLYSAIKKLVDDDQLFVRLCRGTESQSEKFSTEFWNNYFVECCKKFFFIEKT